MRRRSLERRLASILDDRRDREADLVPRRVVGRNADGTEELLALTGECPERGGPGNRAVGQITLRPAGPDFRSRGAAGVALLSDRAAADVLWVEAQEPKELPRGETTVVTLTGRGFEPGDWFQYRLEDGSRNPDLTILAATYVDPETWELEVEVGPGALPVAMTVMSWLR